MHSLAIQALTQRHDCAGVDDVTEDQMEHDEVIRPVPRQRPQNEDILRQTDGEEQPGNQNSNQVQGVEVKPALNMFKLLTRSR